MKENTTCALLRLSQVEESKAMIRRFDAIPLLVSLLESGGLRAKRDASTMLYSLYMVKENKIKAVKAGIMKVLVELMADFESNMVDKLTYVVSVLVEIIEVGTQRQKEIAMVCEDFDGEEHCCEDAVDFDADVHVEVVCDGGVLVAKFLLQRNFQVGEGFSSENPSHVAAVDGENAYLAALVLDYGDAVHGGGSRQSLRNLLLRI
ncbi:U-box domain-containing protein 12 [Glycine soja]